MLKKILIGMVIIGLVLGMSSAFADIELSEESKYGQSIEFKENPDYPGEITIDGLYVYETVDQFVFTIKYSKGELATFDYKGEEKIKTSFFNPPEGTIIKISWISDQDSIKSDEEKIHYLVDKEELEKTIDSNESRSISVFLYDINHNNNAENITVNFKFDAIDFLNIPSENDLVVGGDITTNDIVIDTSDKVSDWVKNNIEELQSEEMLKEDAFKEFKQGITRGRFVYLMVELYEVLTDSKIQILPTVEFNDSQNPYVYKAASIGITSGIGGGNFGPDLIINREQMTTLIIRTLELANEKLSTPKIYNQFSDHDEISEWAKEAIYIARDNSIINGLGDNTFAPKTMATNEQALFILHSLLEKYNDLKWYSEIDKDRLYLKYEDKLYKVNFIKNPLVYNNEILLKSFEDINSFINFSFIDQNNLDFISSSNPNIKGEIIENDLNLMTIFVKNLYSGVDKIGEKMTIEIGDNKPFIAEVSNYITPISSKHSNFIEAKYYDIDKIRKSLYTLSLDQIMSSFEKEYFLTYDSLWDIYVIEFKDKN